MNETTTFVPWVAGRRLVGGELVAAWSDGFLHGVRTIRDQRRLWGIATCVRGQCGDDRAGSVNELLELRSAESEVAGVVATLRNRDRSGIKRHKLSRLLETGRHRECDDVLGSELPCGRPIEIESDLADSRRGRHRHCDGSPAVVEDGNDEVAGGAGRLRD